MASANEKRIAVREKYRSILGRNLYSQARRAYCFKKYSDGKYYSDCSSSIMESYKAAGYPISNSCLNTVGMYQAKALKKVDVAIKNGVVQDVGALRVGDMLLFAGSDSSRAYADCVGHVEMVGEISGGKVYLYGHGSGTPRRTEMNAYCRNRYASKTGTKIGNRGLLKVVRFIQDDGGAGADSLNQPSAVAIKGDSESQKDSKRTVKIVGGQCYVRSAPDKINGKVLGVAKEGTTLAYAGRKSADGWLLVAYKNQNGWVSGKYGKLVV